MSATCINLEQNYQNLSSTPTLHFTSVQTYRRILLGRENSITAYCSEQCFILCGLINLRCQIFRDYNPPPMSSLHCHSLGVQVGDVKDWKNDGSSIGLESLSRRPVPLEGQGRLHHNGSRIWVFSYRAHRRGQFFPAPAASTGGFMNGRSYYLIQGQNAIMDYDKRKCQLRKVFL